MFDFFSFSAVPSVLSAFAREKTSLVFPSLK